MLNKNLLPPSLPTKTGSVRHFSSTSPKKTEPITLLVIGSAAHSAFIAKYVISTLTIASLILFGLANSSIDNEILLPFFGTLVHQEPFDVNISVSLIRMLGNGAAVLQQELPDIIFDAPQFTQEILRGMVALSSIQEASWVAVGDWVYIIEDDFPVLAENIEEEFWPMLRQAGNTIIDAIRQIEERLRLAETVLPQSEWE